MIIKTTIINCVFKIIIYFFRPNKFLSKDKKICGICSLLCHRNVDMFIYSIMSFFYMTRKVLPLYVVDDGSLTRSDVIKLKKYFTIKIANKTSTTSKIKKRLKNYYYLQKFRFDNDTSILKMKLDALLTNPFSKFIYIDSDILFVNNPEEITNWISNDKGVCFYTAHNPYPCDFYGHKDKTVEHSFRLVLFELKSTKTDQTFNSGLLCFERKNKIDLKNMNNTMKYFYEIFYSYDGLAEETVLAFAFDQNKAHLLSTKKYLNVWCYEEYIRNTTCNNISIHYSGPIKYNKFKPDAIKLALKNNLFINR